MDTTTTTTTTTEDTLIQLRAVCPVCFRQHATRGGRMVAHGYKRPQGWGQNVGDCWATGRAHFGTPEGLAVTRDFARRLLESSATLRELAVDTLEGRNPIRDRAGKVVESPTPRQLELHAEKLRGDARANDAYAADVTALADKWTAAEPVPVKVARAAGPLVHFRRPNWGKHCAASRMGAMKGQATVERSGVTCPKCLARLEGQDARAAAAAATVAQS